MKKLLINSFTVFGGVLLVFGLSGCASSIDTKPIYDAYVAEYNVQTPSVEHILKRTDGYSINVREFGGIHKGVKPTVVMMHGFPDNQHLYDLLVTQLEKKYHVITFDFLGWGKSDKPVNHKYNVASQRLDLETVIQKLDLKLIDLVVHDLSGHSGIDWALDNPAKINKLTLLNTYYSQTSSLVAPEAIEFYASKSLLRDLAVWGATKVEARFKGGVSDQLGKFFANPVARERFIPIITNSSGAIRPAFFSATAYLWEEVKAREREIPRLRAFSRPVQIIFGSEDPYLNVGVAKDFQRLFSNVTLDLIPNAGHYVQLDNPEAVAKVMQRTK
jgi:haloalkane dehalogenase